MTIEETIAEETLVERCVAEVLACIAFPSKHAKRRVLIRAIARLDVTEVATTEPTPPKAPCEANLTIAASILEVLRETPRLPMRRIAAAVYGSSDSKRVSNVRAHLHAMKAKGLVRTVERGEWELEKQGCRDSRELCQHFVDTQRPSQ